MGDRMKVIASTRRFGPPTRIAGELGTIIDTTSDRVDFVSVELDNGEEWLLHKDEIEIVPAV